MIPPMLLQALQGMGQQGQQQGQSPIDVQGLFNPIGQAIEAQQPYQEAVPQGPNPFASMGSIFAGTLADMLGAHGAQANAQNRLAERQAMPLEAQQRNTQRADEMAHQKQMQRLQFMEKSAEARLQVALAANDHTLAEKATKDALKAKNDQDKLDKTFQEQQAGREHGYRMAEIGLQNQRPFASQIPATPEEQKAKFDADQEKAIQKFEADINRMRLGSTTKGGKEKVPIPNWPDKTIQVEPGLTKAGIRQIQSHAASQAVGTKYPGLRDAALSQYIDTLRDPLTGEVNMKDKAYPRFKSLLQMAYPKAEDRARFLDSVGIQ